MCCPRPRSSRPTWHRLGRGAGRRAHAYWREAHLEPAARRPVPVMVKAQLHRPVARDLAVEPRRQALDENPPDRLRDPDAQAGVLVDPKGLIPLRRGSAAPEAVG